MNHLLAACAALSDEELIARLKALALDERGVLVELIIHVAVFDDRRLAAPQGQPSTFLYCTRVLGYSEAAAYRRIYAARLSGEYPAALEALSSGEVHLEALALIGPHFTAENHRHLLKRVSGKTCREVQAIVAELAPGNDAPDLIRHLGAVAHPQEPELSAPALLEGADQNASPASVKAPEPSPPAAPAVQRVRFGFTGSEELLRLLRRAQEILKHKYPAGELESIFLDALEALLDKKDPDRRIAAKEERRGPIPAEPVVTQSAVAALGRRIPQAVRDAVWRRDGGQCVHVGPDGSRCVERGGLEYDHIVPWALGGPSNNPKNLRLLCKAHNLMMARRAFGDAKIRDKTLGHASAGPDRLSPGP